MWKSFCRWLLYRRMGWTADVTEAHPAKFIICLAPHTSNWDFIIGRLFAGAEGITSNFLMKREWFRGPLGPFFRRMGGIPVWRSKHTSMTDNLAEGTRSLNPEWKKGFYYIALKSGMPILLYGLDYKRRLIQCTRTIMPTGDIDREMREIKLYFKDFTGKNPEKFTIGEV